MQNCGSCTVWLILQPLCYCPIKVFLHGKSSPESSLSKVIFTKVIFAKVILSEVTQALVELALLRFPFDGVTLLNSWDFAWWNWIWSIYLNMILHSLPKVRLMKFTWVEKTFCEGCHSGICHTKACLCRCRQVQPDSAQKCIDEPLDIGTLSKCPPEQANCTPRSQGTWTRLSHIEHTDIVIWGLPMMNCGHPTLWLDRICQGKLFPQNSDLGKSYRGKIPVQNCEPVIPNWHDLQVVSGFLARYLCTVSMWQCVAVSHVKYNEKSHSFIRLVLSSDWHHYPRWFCQVKQLRLIEWNLVEATYNWVKFGKVNILPCWFCTGQMS